MCLSVHVCVCSGWVCVWGEVGRRIPKWGGGRKWVRKDSIKIKTKKNINFKKRRRKEKETKLPGEGLEKKILLEISVWAGRKSFWGVFS